MRSPTRLTRSAPPARPEEGLDRRTGRGGPPARPVELAAMGALVLLAWR